MRRQEDRNEGGPMHWLSGGGVMGELIRAKDWSASSLGPMEQWPMGLRTALGICVEFPTPCCIVWGRERAQLYNDRYAQLAVARHEAALGEDFVRSWSEVWSVMHACFDSTARGEPSRVENQHVWFERDGAREKLAVTFSFLPLRGESGAIDGLMVTLLEPNDGSLREQLSRAEADRAEYGHVISHDFRSPLRTLEQMSRIVLTDHAEQLPAGATGLLNHIATGAAKLATRADALSRVESLSHQAMHRQAVDVHALTEKVVHELRSAMPERQIDIDVGELPPVEADPELLKIVMNHLLANAFKFTRNVQRARVEVSGRRQGHHNVYCIRDNGAGFDPKYAARLFGFFQRLHTETEFEGHGVGLALVKRLVERHGGTIWAEAEKGRGAEFRFTLPA
jgi:signal transduction histidine kinase